MDNDLNDDQTTPIYEESYETEDYDFNCALIDEKRTRKYYMKYISSRLKSIGG